MRLVVAVMNVNVNGVLFAVGSVERATNARGSMMGRVVRCLLHVA